MRPVLNIAAIIAAAGQSRRMGYHKALLPYYGQSMLEYSIEQLKLSRVKQLFVTLPVSLVLDPHIAKLQAIHQIAVRTNRFPEQGYAGSIRTVLTELDNNIDGIVISPVDCPIANHHLVKAIIRHVRQFNHEPVIVVVNHYGSAGHPVYFSHHFFNAFHVIHAQGPKTIIETYKKYAHALFWSDARVLLNYNTKIYALLNSPNVDQSIQVCNS